MKICKTVKNDKANMCIDRIWLIGFKYFEARRTQLCVYYHIYVKYLLFFALTPRSELVESDRKPGAAYCSN